MASASAPASAAVVSVVADVRLCSPSISASSNFGCPDSRQSRLSLDHLHWTPGSSGLTHPGLPMRRGLQPIDGMIRAIEDGLYTTSMRDHLERLELTHTAIQDRPVERRAETNDQHGRAVCRETEG